MKKVLIVCLTGASSSFIAAKLKKEAQKKEIELDIKARGYLQIKDLLDDVDIVFLKINKDLNKQISKLYSEYLDKMFILDDQSYDKMIDKILNLN